MSLDRTLDFCWNLALLPRYSWGVRQRPGIPISRPSRWGVVDPSDGMTDRQRTRSANRYWAQHNLGTRKQAKRRRELIRRLPVETPEKRELREMQNAIVDAVREQDQFAKYLLQELCPYGGPGPRVFWAALADAVANQRVVVTDSGSVWFRAPELRTINVGRCYR